MNTQHVNLSQLEVLLRPLADRAPKSPDSHLHPWIADACGVDEQDVLEYTILHRSLDARKKPDIRFVYRLAVQIREDAIVQDSQHVKVQTPEPEQEHFLYQLPLCTSLPKHPLVVGTGPAGLMAAYLLAMHGCKPLILDRGFDVDRRRQDIDTFLQTRQLNPESNYLLGEGGAGTYSDGKLYTRVKDPRIRFLLDAYISARAPRRIRYEHHPHIGSDILPCMVKRLRRQIEAWGGEFRWGAAVQDILVRQDRCQGVILNNGETIEAPLTLIACGHSARDLLQTLVHHGISHRVKDFQLGYRIEHPQHVIDRAQYGWIPPRQLVGAAEYTMTNRPPARSNLANTTTFCMCPGGEIIAATSHEGQLCTNGMSRFLRNGAYANAGLIINQPASHFPSVYEAFQMLDSIERQAFSAGAGKDGGAPYRSPAQSALKFVQGESGLDSNETSYRFGIVPARLDRLLPLGTVLALQDALKYFERLIPGFMTSGTLIGVETRVSSPVRFERNPETCASSLPGLYLLGEGAGYSGGITSSALDGLRIAETVLTGKPATRKRR
ncbi:hypothetical protein CSA56_12055 [candidate division KSB3 bacterium]|uniref:Uncharacterized protein n=1 Tax=candidate division KSB3 bacterium TaxID=2044937 RepID=A0A2G6KCI4_9BACT|nr:MAG: hypothetical protein CSA56_12055 [candidate division KSB3 bacterium]